MESADEERLNVKPQVDMVFSIANSLRGAFTPEHYRDVIIPMTILRRLECAIDGTRDSVADAYDANHKVPDAILRRKAGLDFYNTGRWTLKRLLADPQHLARNLKTYVGEFSPNVKEIFDRLEFGKQVDKMAKESCLTGTVRKFADLDLDPATVPNHAMGYMFEEIIRRFSENAEAGDHFTPREVVRLLVRLALAEGCEDLTEPGKVITVGDVACGTGGMLSVADEELARLAPDADVYLYGQEILDESYAICKADMLMKGDRSENIRKADTMKEDCFPDTTLRLQCVNPPFGQPWGGKDAKDGVEKAVIAESKRYGGRFPWGLPAKSDMQLLFMQHIVHKMDKERGRACVISNGSPLFSGGTSSGESQVRRGLLEGDLIEAIVALPTDLFYNTGIGIYVWVLSRDKRPERRGKVQLIDATDLWTPMRRSLGNKRRMLSEDQVQQIVDCYTAFEEGEHCRILPNEAFLYHEYATYRPTRRNYMLTADRVEALGEGKFMDTMHNPAKLAELEAVDPADRTSQQESALRKLRANEPTFGAMLDALRGAETDRVWYDPKSFKRELKRTLSGVDAAANVLDKLVDRLSDRDEDAPVQRDRQGQPVPDPATKDTEVVSLAEDVNAYMEREVWPYVPDAIYFDEESDKAVKTGAEIPFTRYFYQYVPPEPSDDLLREFQGLEAELDEELKGLV